MRSSWSTRRCCIGGVDRTRQVQSQGAMAGAGLEDFNRGLCIAGRRGVDMDIEEGDDQIAIMRIDLLA